MILQRFPLAPSLQLRGVHEIDSIVFTKYGLEDVKNRIQKVRMLLFLWFWGIGPAVRGLSSIVDICSGASSPYLYVLLSFTGNRRDQFVPFSIYCRSFGLYRPKIRLASSSKMPP
jgi:hypothetical protein